MEDNNFISKKEYDELKEKYEKLNKKHSKLESRMGAILKINDRTFKTFFDKNQKAEKFYKRFDTILKQGDKQSKHWLIENEKKDHLLMEQSKMASMGKMIDNIAHQMKQPLSIISTSSTLMELKKEMDSLSDEEFIKYTSKITDTTKYLSETIDNFSRFFHHKKLKDKFSLTTIIVKSKQLLESKFKGKGIKIVHELNDVMIIGVENDLIQVITNLLSNSIDALMDKKEQKYIFIRSSVLGEHIEIEFGDSAGGIDKKIINDIFKSHFSTKKREDGSGIGLHMSRMIIEEKFGGNINVFNKEYSYNDKSYMGACFIISIPKNDISGVELE